MTVESFFPTLIHRARLARGPSGSKVPRFLAALAREAQAFRELDAVGEKWSRQNYPGGYTSYSSITDLAFRSSNFDYVREFLDREVASFARTLDLDLGRGKLQMSSFWINIMGEGCHHSFHLHPLSTISGTFYVQIEKGAGCLKLEDPRLPAFMGSPPRKSKARVANQRFVNLEPKAGDVILFESWVKHEVPANRARRERISVSFNYDWID